MKNLSALLSLLICSPSLALHVVVDPGHGGKDHGATKGQIHESRIVLAVSKELASLLEADSRFEVTLTRSSDRFLSLKQRTQIASQSGADLLVSIHVNSSPDSRAHGAEFYFQNQLPADEESLFLASRENELEEHPPEEHSHHHLLPPIPFKAEVKTILLDLLRNQRILDSSVLTKSLRENWKGIQRSRRHSIRQAPFYVVSQSSVPSVLIELGFLTHPDEGRKLTQKSYQHLLARSIYEGLIRYKELMDKQPKSPLNNVHAKRSTSLE